ncbi:MAG: PIN domain-containing protein [Desulfuromonadales bacterium]|nr:PIN domain-containing protein [Desulfuromonadales bacterium]
MKQYLIDTNALISFVTDRNPAQQEAVARLFEQAAQARAAVLCPQNVLVEFAYVMDKIYRQPKPLVRQMLTDFIALPGATVVNDVDFAEVLDLWPEPIADFGDALVAATARRAKRTVLVTFDKDFIRMVQKLKITVWEDD